MKSEENSNEVTKSNYSIPVAIVLAGVIIAGAMYFNDGQKVTGPEKVVAPVVKGAGSIDQVIPVSSEDHIRGNPNASLIIVEYSDTECPFCKRFQTTMQGVMDTYGKNGEVAWVYRHFPLDSLHSKSRKEAEATECANELGGDDVFWKYIDLIYTNTPSNNGLEVTKLSEFAKTVGLDVTKFEQCLSSGKYASKVEGDLQGGVKIGIQGTPFSIMILNKALSSDVHNNIDEYVNKNQLVDISGKPYIYTSADNMKVAVNGALPLEMIKNVIDIILK